MKIRTKDILICDDHNLFGQGICQLLTREGHRVVCVNSSEKCIEKLTFFKYDVFFCDLNIDHNNGFDIIESNKAHLSETQVFLITAYTEDYLIEKAEKKGLQGFLDKSASSEKLFTAIHLAKGSPFFSSVERISQQNDFAEKNKFSPSKLLLSNQEKEVIKWVVFGLTSKEIGDRLFISKNTVDTHRRNISKKLEIQGVSSLIRFAHENNLVD